MIYYLHLLEEWYSPFRIFNYITFRCVCAAITALILSWIIGGPLIRWLTSLKCSQQFRKEEAPPLYQLHQNKVGTPTMGGLLIILVVSVSSLLWVNLGNLHFWLVILTFWVMGAIGFLDDWLKISRKQSKGLSIRQKLVGQVGWALIIGLFLYYLPENWLGFARLPGEKELASQDLFRTLMIPVYKFPIIESMGIFAIVFFVVVLVGSTNAVNITDGLDGLAIGITIPAFIAFAIMVYVSGHSLAADYLLIPYIPEVGEIAIFAVALVGASLGFLWFNCHPAQIFMGDTGALAIGGALGIMASLIKQEFVLLIVGGVFVIEAVSVIIQVISFRTRGKRVFAMAPIHHHFELKGWSETKVVVRFWILSILFALFGVGLLKIR